MLRYVLLLSVFILFPSEIYGQWKHLFGYPLQNDHPSPVPNEYSQMVIDSKGRYVYTFGGLNNPNELWQYDLAKKTWLLLSGNKDEWRPNYDIPYPGYIDNSRMVIDNTDTYLYSFGGYGNDAKGNRGIKLDVLICRLIK